MITHRFATQQPLPPARAYKFIAIAFLVITMGLFAVIVFMLTKKTAITVIAKEDVKNVSLTVRVAAAPQGDSIAGTVTTTKFFFSQKFSPTGTKTVPGISKGTVTLYNKTEADQPLVKITRLLSPQGVLFRLSERVLVPAREQAQAAVYADQAGAASDIQPTSFTIPGLSADKQKVIYAESSEAMSGGVSRVGALSDVDLQNAKEQFKAQAAEAFLKTASSTLGPGRHLVAVSADGVSASDKSGDEVSQFTLAGTTTVVIVAYDAKDLQKLLETAVGSKINAESEKVLSLGREPKVALANYQVEKGTAELTVTENVVVTLDANGTALAARNFLGKKKDEIERYIMALDHAYAVDIKFSPSWLNTAPSAPDRIKVVVKSVK